MKRNVKLFVAILSSFVIGCSVNNFAFSNIPSRIAVVDVSQVVKSSSQVLALKNEQEAKAKDMITFIEKARKEVAATTDAKKKASLEEKYNKELNAKKEAAEANYNAKLKAIDNSISNQIASQAKLNNYDIVLAKGVVLYGGDDITEAVKQAVNDSEKAAAKTQTNYKKRK